MASTDWVFTNGITGFSYVGGVSGSAVTHTSLSNPLTGYGSYCRAFAVQNDSQRAAISMRLNSVPELSSSLGLSYGYTYSLRTWLRSGGASQQNQISLVFKGTNIFNVTDTPNILNHIPAGYVLFVVGSLLYLRCAIDPNYYTSGGNSSTDAPNNGLPYLVDLTSAGGFTMSTWKRYRMDVVGLGSLDRITIYVGSTSDPLLWTQIHTVDIPQVKTAAYIPWATAGNPNPPSFITPNGRGFVGYAFNNYHSNSPTYIDQFEAYRELVLV
jgi:hypothetical protein